MKNNKGYYEFIILGAGVAGLGAGIALKRKAIKSLIIEKDSVIGGLNKNSTISGCDFDFGPKILLLDDSENSREILSFLGDNYIRYPSIENTYLSEYGLMGFPLQRHLIDLPEDIRNKVIEEIGQVKNTTHKIKSFKDWLIGGFGEYFCKLVMFPYEEKKWLTSLDQMDYKWTVNRPIKVNYDEIIKGAKTNLPPNKYYYYPKVGNISTLTQAMGKSVDSVLLNTEVTGINLKNKYVRTTNGDFHYRYLISSLPLDYITSITDDLPKDLQSQSCKDLKRLGILVFNLVFKKDKELKGTAIYFPEKKFIFRRVSILENLCPALARKGLMPISVEISVQDISRIKPKDVLKDILLNFKEIDGLRDLKEPLEWEMLKVDFAYPIQLNGLSETVREIHGYYEKFGIYHCGRGGNFDYCNSDQAYKQGKETVSKILEKQEGIY